MSRLLLIGNSHGFETRLHLLFGAALSLVKGQFLAFGPSAVLGRLHAADRPDVALLGSTLSHGQTSALSTGLATLYPGVGIVIAHGHQAGTDRWVSDRTIHAVLSPRDEQVVLLTPTRARYTRAEPDSVRKAHRPDAEKVPEVWLGFEPELESNAFPASAGDPDVFILPPPAIETVAAAAGIRCQVIAVVSAKGGVGKTTVATNLAVGLARLAPLSVVLVDADVQFGDVATALSLTPAHTLPDAVTDAAKLDTMVLKTYLTPHESGFYTVCGADTPVDGDRVSGEQLSHLIRQLSEVFRFVVIDTAPGLGEHALAALELATDAVIVCDMSVPSARGLRKELAALASIGIVPPTRHVVLNLGDRFSGLSVRDIEATIGVPVDIAIRRSKLMALSTNRGVPILADGSRNSASNALTALVRRFDPTAARKHGRLHRRVVVA
ncbi:AAA family ATPase [Cryobacterium lyxosi]|uniref:MinD/ParA family protein n=1 Tax=Cryobacterium lyxosi TaxID=1259228 RepID=A0A4R8ZE41_9MICO|nr:AAA family ATPase [Cryobacterium lyxosi]TFD25473.1 MinD/ParA family protein [Cryobacterium lyxosi]